MPSNLSICVLPRLIKIKIAIRIVLMHLRGENKKRKPSRKIQSMLMMNTDYIFSVDNVRFVFSFTSYASLSLYLSLSLSLLLSLFSLMVFILLFFFVVVLIGSHSPIVAYESRCRHIIICICRHARPKKHFRKLNVVWWHWWLVADLASDQIFAIYLNYMFFFFFFFFASSSSSPSSLFK